MTELYNCIFYLATFHIDRFLNVPTLVLVLGIP